MTVEKAWPAERTGGCGCGGSGMPAGGCAGCGGGCGGGSSGDGAAGPYAYVRPRFFAGQLLTEDDLELLGSYTAAKHRLHNRYLFGAGVVCGLEVACDPCGGGKVKVAPGYALDCCGSDIVVPSPVSVDVNAQIRELYRAQLGVDCGDPCTDPAEPPEPGKPAPTRQYFLYIRYAEALADPVTPYVTDEPCGQQGCEPSRVRESFRFVLRSDGYGRPNDDFRTRMAACAPPEDPQKVAGGIERLTRYARPMLFASRPGPDTAFDVDAVAAAVAKLPVRQGAAAPAPDEARALTEAVRLLASELVRLQLQDDETRAVIDNDPQAIQKIKTGREALAAAVTTLSAAPDDTWTDEMDRRTADELLAQVGTLADPKAPPLGRVQARMLAQGLPLGAGVLAMLHESGTELRAWLLRRLDRATDLTDCGLRAAVAALHLPAPSGENPVLEEQAVARAADANDELMRLVDRYKVSCQCGALLPPCPSCLDTDVLLAAIEVRDCEVVSICNVVRDLVVSPAALRYWVPQLRTLQDTLVRLCCGESIGRPVEGVPSVVPAFSTAGGAGRGNVWPTAFDVRDLFPDATPASPSASVSAALAQPVAAAPAELPALHARVDELSRLLTEISGKLMTEKGRITKLQNHVNRLPGR